MGIGMALFTASRRRRGWSWCRVVRHFVVRSFVLFFVGRVVRVYVCVFLGVFVCAVFSSCVSL